MRVLITFSLLVTIVTFLGCSMKDKSPNSNAQNKSIVEQDTIKSIDQALSGVENKNEVIDNKSIDTSKIDFPLDSLLAFDSEYQLIEAFKPNVKRSIGYYPEGMGEYNNTLLFPNTKNEVEFVWTDDSLGFSGLLFIKISDNSTDWRTKEGISIGTGISELERLNKKEFTFYGLGWDYSGMIDWQGGYLDERGIFGSLEYSGEVLPNEFEGLLGDHEIESSSKLAQDAHLILREITMRKVE